MRPIDNLPPHAIAVDELDALVVSIYQPTGSAAQSYTLGIRLILPTGKLQQWTEQIPAVTTLGGISRTIRLTEGYLIAVSAALGTAVDRVWQYATISLQRGTTPAPQQQLQLLAGHFATAASLSWPYSPQRLPSDYQPGSSNLPAFNNPAAGSDFTYTLPANEVAQISHLMYELTTSAAVASRVPTLRIEDSGAIIWQQAFAAVAASSTILYSLWRQLPTTTAPANTVYAQIPDLLPREGLILSSSTALIQAADQWSIVSAQALQRLNG